MSKKNNRLTNKYSKSPIELIVAKYGLFGTIATGFLSVIGVVLTAYFGYLGIKLQAESRIVAEKTAEAQKNNLSPITTPTPTIILTSPTMFAIQPTETPLDSTPVTITWLESPRILNISRKAQSNSIGLTVTTIYQGVMPNSENLIFDIIITNDSSSQRVLTNFNKEWRYNPGDFKSNHHPDVLVPMTQYIIKFPITSWDVQFGTDVIYPPLVIPPKSGNESSKTSLRLQLNYYFDNDRIYYGGGGWDINFDLVILDDTGNSLSIFSNQSWRELVYIHK